MPMYETSSIHQVKSMFLFDVFWYLMRVNMTKVYKFIIKICMIFWFLFVRNSVNIISKLSLYTYTYFEIRAGNFCKSLVKDSTWWTLICASLIFVCCSYCLTITFAKELNYFNNQGLRICSMFSQLPKTKETWNKALLYLRINISVI